MSDALTLRTLGPQEHALWDALVRASAQGTVYHESPWLNAVSRLTGNPTSVYGMFDGKRLVAGVALQLRRRGPLSIAQRAWATPYAGIVIHPDAWSELRPELKVATERLARRFSCLTLSGSPFVESLEADLPWEREQRATYVLRSRSLGGLWRSLASEVRNRIRRAEREGVCVRIEAGVDGFFEIYRDVFKRRGFSMGLDARGFGRFLEHVTALGVGRLYAARLPDGRLCAACLVVFDRRRAYYSLAASHAELRKNGASSLLVWEAMRDLFQTFDELDFGGANLPHVAQFKSRFRGLRIEYPVATVYRSRIERLAIDAFRRRGRLLGSRAAKA